MAAREFDHALSEWGTPEVSVESPPHLGGAAQLSAEVCTPPCSVRVNISAPISLGQQFRRTQSVVNSLARHWIGESRRVTKQGPIVATNCSTVPRLCGQSRNACSITFSGCIEMRANVRGLPRI